MGFFLFMLIIVAVIAAIVIGIIQQRKRREALRAIAAELGFSYSHARDRELAARLQFLNRLAQGANRYAFNVMRGASPRGEPVFIFDYHYETSSTDSKGNRTTHDHYLACYIVVLPKSFPELLISREGFLSKIAQAFGFDDIDFESHEFSRKFCVRSADKKFAYDVCHAQTMEYLLKNPDLNIEIEGRTLAFVFPGRLKVDRIRYNYQRLLHFRDLLPEYLFETP